MKRPIVLITVFLVAGALVNFVVACGYKTVHHGPAMALPEVPEGQAIKQWNRYALPEWPRIPSEANRFVQSAMASDVLYSEHGEKACLLIVTRVGWPCLSFQGAKIDEYRGSRFEGWIVVARSTQGLSELIEDESVPLEPIWPGFAINTIFYAAVLWMVFAFPFVVRRRRRIKRGLCPACAYPVGTSPVCTECGKPVKQSTISGQQSAKVQS